MGTDRTHSKQARREAAALLAAGPTLLWMLVAFAVLPGGLVLTTNFAPVLLLESSFAELPRRAVARPSASPARASFAVAKADSYEFSGFALPAPSATAAIPTAAARFVQPLELRSSRPSPFETIVLTSIDLPPPAC